MEWERQIGRSADAQLVQPISVEESESRRIHMPFAPLPSPPLFSCFFFLSICVVNHGISKTPFTCLSLMGNTYFETTTSLGCGFVKFHLFLQALTLFFPAAQGGRLCGEIIMLLLREMGRCVGFDEAIKGLLICVAEFVVYISLSIPSILFTRGVLSSSNHILAQNQPYQCR